MHLHLRYSCQSVCLFSTCPAGSLTSPKGVEQRQPNAASGKDQVASRIVGRSKFATRFNPTGPFLSLAVMFARPRPVPCHWTTATHLCTENLWYVLFGPP